MTVSTTLGSYGTGGLEIFLFEDHIQRLLTNNWIFRNEKEEELSAAMTEMEETLLLVEEEKRK